MTGPKPSSARLVAFYSGRVQGVGFRATTRYLAAPLPIAGFVKNLSDGRVMLIAEGEKADLDRLLLDIDGEMSGLISGVDLKWETPCGEFDSFEIRR